MKRSRKKDPNVYPPGLDAKKVREIIAYYETRQGVDLLGDARHRVLRAQSRSEESTAWVEVPLKLVPQVNRLIRRSRKAG